MSWHIAVKVLSDDTPVNLRDLGTPWSSYKLQSDNFRSTATCKEYFASKIDGGESRHLEAYVNSTKHERFDLRVTETASASHEKDSAFRSSISHDATMTT